MDIRTSLDGLKSLLGVPTTPPAATQTKSNTAAGGSALASDRVVYGISAQHHGVLGPGGLHRGEQPEDRVVLFFHDGAIG